MPKPKRIYNTFTNEVAVLPRPPKPKLDRGGVPRWRGGEYRCAWTEDCSGTPYYRVYENGILEYYSCYGHVDNFIDTSRVLITVRRIRANSSAG